MVCDYLVVGAGFYGSVIAERIANVLKEKVLVIDKRKHTGGNCHSKIDPDTGIEYHVYGTHVFHTSNKEVWDYINQFTEFNGYHHQVLTQYKNRVYQMPINLETINSFYNVNLTPYEAIRLLDDEVKKENISNPKNLEEKAISMIGRPLYEAFIKGYTKKQWNKDPKDLPASIIERIPVRFNYMEDYFINSRYQGIPLEGYHSIFNKLLDDSRIDVELGVDYFEVRNKIKVSKRTIYTGPIDQFFDYKYGVLGWRTVEFKKQIVPYNDFQGTSVMNYAESSVPYTRIHEPRHLHPEHEYKGNSTLIFYEYSSEDHTRPYYPINNNKNRKLILKYKKLADKCDEVMFGGRLSDYAYYDMDKTIGKALECFQQLLELME